MSEIKKIYFTAPEIGLILGEKPLVIRYWAKHFGVSRGKKKRYNIAGVCVIAEIQRLLRVEKYTIKGVSQKLSGFVDLTEHIGKFNQTL